MAKNTNKTKPEAASVEDFIAAVKSEQKREDARRICAMMARLSGEKPTMWGPSIVGFGTCHYRYDSGREGDMPRVGFSPRTAALVFYLADGFPGYAELMARLGKFTKSKACLYVKRLADVDETVLEALVAESLAEVKRRYPD
jgi:hypothetical protein